jgi:CheY-like chemotaxis protein
MEPMPKYLLENSLEGVSVLLTDDDSMNQFVAKKFLTKWGMNVTVASNGLEALELIQSRKFQIVLMDIHMPVMDGMEAVRQIRAMEDNYFKTIPIIAFSAVIEKIEIAKEIGMTDFAMKPIDPTELHKRITRHYLKAHISESEEARDLFIDFNSYTDGDDEFKRELIMLMIDNIQDLQNSVKQSHFRHDAQLFDKILHKVKPTLSMLDDNEVTEILAQLQTAGLEEQPCQEIAERSFQILGQIATALQDEADAANKVLSMVTRAA